MRKSVIAFMILLCWPSTANAKVVLTASPAKLDVLVEPGEARSVDINLTNNGSGVLHLRASASDWWYTKSAPKAFARAGTFERSAASWISLAPASFALEPSQSRSVRVTIAVPPDANGGHYAAVFFELVPPKAAQEGLEFRSSARLGVLVAQLDNRTARASLELDNGRLDPPSDASPMRLSFRARNPGNVHLRPTGSVAIVSQTGRYFGKFPLNAPPQLLPGQAGDIAGSWVGVLSPGDYEAIATVTYFGNKAMVKRVRFRVPPSSPPVTEDSPAPPK